MTLYCTIISLNKNHRTQVLLLRLCVEGMFRGPWAMTHWLPLEGDRESELQLSLLHLIRVFRLSALQTDDQTITLFTFIHYYCLYSIDRHNLHRNKRFVVVQI